MKVVLLFVFNLLRNISLLLVIGFTALILIPSWSPEARNRFEAICGEQVFIEVPAECPPISERVPFRDSYARTEGAMAFEQSANLSSIVRMLVLENSITNGDRRKLTFQRSGGGLFFLRPTQVSFVRTTGEGRRKAVSTVQGYTFQTPESLTAVQQRLSRGTRNVSSAQKMCSSIATMSRVFIPNLPLRLKDPTSITRLWKTARRSLFLPPKLPSYSND